MTIPVPNESGYRDQELAQYILGQLPADDTERLDEASIVDDDVATRLRLVEQDLVDTYVRGGLTGDALKAFETHYLASARRRNLTEFARRFVPAVNRVAESARSGPTETRRWRVPVWLLGVAAALLLVVSSGLLIQTVRLSRDLTVAREEQSRVGQRSRELERQLADARTANTSAARDLANAREATNIAPSVPAIALLLLPQTRSIGDLPTLTLPAGADRVGFQLRLESNDFPRYQVGLRDPAVNQVIWRSGWIGAEASDNQASLRVDVPARLLRLQHYSLEVSGRTTAGAGEVVTSYAFEVASR